MLHCVIIRTISEATQIILWILIDEKEFQMCVGPQPDTYHPYNIGNFFLSPIFANYRSDSQGVIIIQTIIFLPCIKTLVG